MIPRAEHQDPPIRVYLVEYRYTQYPLKADSNWIGHTLRRHFLFHYAIEVQMTEVKGVGRIRTQLLDDLRYGS